MREYRSPNRSPEQSWAHLDEVGCGCPEKVEHKTQTSWYLMLNFVLLILVNRHQLDLKMTRNDTGLPKQKSAFPGLWFPQDYRCFRSAVRSDVKLGIYFVYTHVNALCAPVLQAFLLDVRGLVSEHCVAYSRSGKGGRSTSLSLRAESLSPIGTTLHRLRIRLGRESARETNHRLELPLAADPRDCRRKAEDRART